MTRLILMTAIGLMAAAGPARAELLLWDPFDYADGSSIDGLSGSTERGFDAASAWSYSGGHTADILADSIAFGDLYVTGNKGRASSDNALNEITSADRGIDFSVTGGAVWTSWLTQTNSGATASGRGVSIDDASDNRDFSTFSKRNGTSGPGAVTYDSTTSNTGSGIANSTPYLIIGKFSGVGSASGTGTIWMVSQSEFDAISSGGISESELNATVGADRIATVNAGPTPTIDLDSVFKIHTVDTSGSTRHAFWFDELRVGTSLADVAPVTQALAIYGFQHPDGNGNFNNQAFDSVDTHAGSTASRLSNSGFTGGGAGVFIQNDTWFGSSDSGSPGLNIGNANQTTATNYISFDVTPNAGFEIVYESLTLYSSTFAANDTFTIELRVVDGGGIEQLLGTYDQTTGGSTNQPVSIHTIDFADFASLNATEWRIYAYGTDGNPNGVRLDDITLYGAVLSVPAPATLPAGLALLGIVAARRRRAN